MNRRKFVALAGLAPLIARSAQRDAKPAGQPFVVLPEGARTYESGHGETRILIGSKESGGKWWLGNFLSDPGRKTSLHVHYSADEQIYVLEGVLSVWLDDLWRNLPAGAMQPLPAEFRMRWATVQVIQSVFSLQESPRASKDSLPI